LYICYFKHFLNDIPPIVVSREFDKAGALIFGGKNGVF